MQQKSLLNLIVSSKITMVRVIVAQNWNTAIVQSSSVVERRAHNPQVHRSKLCSEISRHHLLVPFEYSSDIQRVTDTPLGSGTLSWKMVRSTFSAMFWSSTSAAVSPVYADAPETRAAS